MAPMSATERQIKHDIIELKDELQQALASLNALKGQVGNLDGQVSTLNGRVSGYDSRLSNLDNRVNSIDGHRLGGNKAAETTIVPASTGGDWRPDLEELQLQINVWKADVVSQLASITAEVTGKGGVSARGGEVALTGGSLENRVQNLEDNQSRLQQTLNVQEQRFTKTLQSMEGYFGNAISQVSVLRDTLASKSNAPGKALQSNKGPDGASVMMNSNVPRNGQSMQPAPPAAYQQPAGLPPQQDQGWSQWR